LSHVVNLPGNSASTPPTDSAEGLGAVMRNRNFLALWIAQAITQTSAQMIWFVMIIIVEEQTQSSAHLSLALLTTIVPSVAFGLLAGVVVDRVDKKAVLVVTNLLRAISVLGYLLYSTSLYVVYVVNLIFVSISQFFAPAEVSMIPALVPRRQLITATSLFNLTWTASQLVGIVLLAPWLVKFFGATVVFLMSAGIYAAATVLVAMLPASAPPERTLASLKRETLVHDVRGELHEAWSFIISDRQTWWAMLTYTVGNALMLVIVMLTPRYMVSILGVKPEDAVFVFAPAGVGILAITAFLTVLSNRFGKERLVDGGIICTTAALFCIAGLQRAENLLLPGVLSALGWLVHLPFRQGLVPPLMILAAVLGVGYALLTVPAQAILLERAPATTRGRIFAVLLMLVNVAAVIPLVVLGNLADRIGVNSILALLAALVAVLAIVTIRDQRQRATRLEG